MTETALERTYVVLDIETTGLNPDLDKIIEVCAVRLDDKFQVTEEFYAMIRIDTPLPPKITQLTGIVDLDLATKGEEAETVYRKLHGFVSGKVLVGHNIDDFDMKFLRKAFSQVGLQAENETYDTLKKSKECFKFYSYKLADMAKNLNIESRSFHNARGDVEVTVELFKHLVRAER